MSGAKAPAPLEDAQKNTLKIENTEKRDSMIKDEQRFQKVWEDKNLFEIDAPSTAEIPFGSISPEELRSKVPKNFECFAYPYQNGTLHAGHAFTISKTEFATGYARMKGKRALFPLRYHATGMPIKACADKLVREVEMFGKHFENYKEEQITDEVPAPTQSETKTDITSFKATKGKAGMKAVAAKYQFQIMLAQGFPLEEIHLFADPQHWLKVFPPLAKQHMSSFGARVDWRRQFITTPANPYYDRFVEWQMRKLKTLGKIKFGKRYTVYSPKDGQACLDHDRSSGEGVTVQEYTALKMQVKEFTKAAQEALSTIMPADASAYLIPATLRPETVYGATAVYVSPTLTYGVYKVTDKEYYITSHRSARNMAYQGIFPEWEVFPEVCQLKGSELIGSLVNAPLSVHTAGVRVLPMDTVKDTKGTAVVLSVPSDSPDDYAMTLELQKKAAYYKIDEAWTQLDIIPIIETPGYGDLIAPTLYKQMKIQSPKDAKKLEEAKGIAYKEGFYKGTMLVGEFKGKPVQEAKDIVRQRLIDAGVAFKYAEPDGLVISRSGDTCVAALLDQWYMNYGTDENGGDGEWCASVMKYVEEELNTYYPEARHQLISTLKWLSHWACERSYGLGSKLPWGTSGQLVESLSDSTIYMAYYTVAHLLHSDYWGQKPGKLKDVPPESMTDDVWDYVFARRDDANFETSVSKESLEALRREFEYFYPLDCRISGKDLLQNHLVFMLYIHAAIFPQKYWPRGIRVNGHLMLNGEKMSKSTGNFLTMDQAVTKFGADATRIALADAGDGIEDANFEESVANSSILRLFELKKWCDEIVKDAKIIESPEQYKRVRDDEKVKNVETIQRAASSEKLLWDKLFENDVNTLVKETEQHYDGTMYKLALKSGLYDLSAALSFYKESTKAAGVGMHHGLVLRFIEIQALLLCPVAPHTAEYLWQDVLKNDSSIQMAFWPSVPDADPALGAALNYIRATTSNITSSEGQQVKKMAKGKTVSYNPKEDKKITIFAAQKFPDWQEKYLEEARQAFDGMTIDTKAVMQKVPKPEIKKAAPFIQNLKKRLDAGENSDAVFNRRLPFSELDILRAMIPIIPVPKLKNVEIVSVDDGGKTGIVLLENGKEGEKRAELPPMAASAEPGSPTFLFENA